MIESLQFRSQAMAFASSSSGNKPFTMKEDIGFNFKRPFENQPKKLRLIKASTCVLGEQVNHTLVDIVQRLVKNATPVKRWDSSQKRL